MTRIQGLPDRAGGLFARLAFFMARRRLGRVPGPLRVQARHASVLAAVGGFEMALERATRVDPVAKSLAMLRAATLVGCPF